MRKAWMWVYMSSLGLRLSLNSGGHEKTYVIIMSVQVGLTLKLYLARLLADQSRTM